MEKAQASGGGGMHSGEPYLIRKLTEEVGGRIHLGRSSGDLGEVGKRIFFRDQLLDLIDTVVNFRETLIKTATANLDTIMPGYTHAQHAQPTTWGHMILSWVSVLERDTERLFLTFSHANRSPAGAAILTGSDFPLNRQRVGDLLGFASVEKNTYDAILCHDNQSRCSGTASCTEPRALVRRPDALQHVGIRDGRLPGPLLRHQ